MIAACIPKAISTTSMSTTSMFMGRSQFSGLPQLQTRCFCQLRGDPGLSAYRLLDPAVRCPMGTVQCHRGALVTDILLPL
jgi:hypothetical protein